MNYGLSKSIQYKLFHGVVIPTGIKQGLTMADHAQVTAMMNAVVKKYHSLSKEHRQLLITKAEKNIEDVLNGISKGKDESSN